MDTSTAPRRRRIVRLSASVVGAAVLSLGAAACSNDTKDKASDAVSSAATDVRKGVDAASRSAAETLARNIATEQGEEQFKNAGYELNGKLTCDASAEDSATEVAVNCTGTTKTGKAAKLTGTTNELPGASATELDGSFTGTVDGQQAFTTQRLGG
jgi:hypothetical protein